MSSWGAGVPDREAEMGRRRGLLLRCVRNSQEAEVSLIERGMEDSRGEQGRVEVDRPCGAGWDKVRVWFSF